MKDTEQPPPGTSDSYIWDFMLLIWGSIFGAIEPAAAVMPHGMSVWTALVLPIFPSCRYKAKIGPNWKSENAPFHF